MTSGIRLTSDNYRNLASSREFEWLGPEVPSARMLTTWRCSQGHEWQAWYSAISAGNGCPYCAGKMRKLPQDYRELAAQYGLEWLGPEVPNNRSKTTWRCAHGHEWQGRYNDISQGRGCPHCAGLIAKKSTDYSALAAQYGLEWLGPEVPNNRSKTTWRCSEGHEWVTPYKLIAIGNGCPYCAGNKPKTSADYHALAAKRGFEWLGSEVPTNSKTKTTWRCPQGHEWNTMYNSISNGHGCPHCLGLVNGHYTSSQQLALHEMLGGELNYRIGRSSLDIAFPANKLCIEYDCWYWHNPERDARRDQKLIALDWRILRIKSAYLLPTRQQLDDAIAQLLAGETYLEIILDDWKQAG